MPAVAALLAVACSLLAPARGSAAETLVREIAAMGTRLRVTVAAADRRVAIDSSEAAVRQIEAAEARLSTWGRDSDLARLNRSPLGHWVALSPELERDLRAAVHWWRETGGAFDPGVAGLVAAWDLRAGGRVPRAADLAAALTAAGLRHLEISGSSARRNAVGFGVDEGAFGKGIALDAAASAAVAAGARCVEIDLGGQLVLAGDCGVRAVGVAHPRRRQEIVAHLDLRAGSAATSGNSERSIAFGGAAIGHLLDPETGRPVDDWGSVTVVAGDATAADCLATALYVMGPERGLLWASARADVEALFAVADGDELELVATPGLPCRPVSAEMHVRRPTARSAGDPDHR